MGARIVRVFGNFAQNLALHNKNNRVLLSQVLFVMGSLGNLMFKLHKIFVVMNIKFPRATYHSIVPSTEELYCLITCIVHNSTSITMLKSLSCLNKGFFIVLYSRQRPSLYNCHIPCSHRRPIHSYSY